MRLTQFELIIIIGFLSNTLEPLNYLLRLLPFIYAISFIFLKLVKIYFLFIILQIIPIPFLNFTCHFLLKDPKNRKTLLQGLSRNGHYQLCSSSNKKYVLATFVIGHTYASLWHARMVHPSFKIVYHVLRSLQLSVSNNNVIQKCLACLGSKSKSRQFTYSLTQTKLFYN